MVKGNSLRINLERKINDSYDIVFGKGLFSQIASELKPDFRYVIITDSNVKPLYGDKLLSELISNGLDADIFSFAAGEKSKNVFTCVDKAEEMAELKYGRDSVILALGGGVVGDMAGWIAANYLRGIPFIQIPTTLLAQADSSVGGKTGVDLKSGKNLFGRIEQPTKVYIDVLMLQTLDDREIRNGLAETIKHGVIQDPVFFEYLNKHIDELLQKDLDSLLYIAKQNCRIKGNVVEQDPNEKGLRRILNYGHTAGHAIEKLSGYELSHGEAVSIGMMAAGRIAMNYGFPEYHFRQEKKLLERAGLPVRIPDNISNEAIILKTSIDKKAQKGTARYCLPAIIGKMHEFDGMYATNVNEKFVLKALDESR